MSLMMMLQVNNRLDGSLEPFSVDQQRVLEIAAEQLSELLYGRADIVIHSSAVNANASSSSAAGGGAGNKGMHLVWMRMMMMMMMMIGDDDR